VLIWREVSRGALISTESANIKQIPSHAIISTFALDDFVRCLQKTPSMAEVFQMEVLGRRGGYQTTIRPALGGKGIKLGVELVAGLAKMSLCLGLARASYAIELSYLIRDVVQGWNVALDPREPAEWETMAAAFTHTIVCASKDPVSFSDQLQLQHAFIVGITKVSTQRKLL
jgi:hypothetical protein